jgi:hypothetical protein
VSRWIICVKFWELSRKHKKRLNRSSERKVMPVLRRTLRVKFLWWRWWIRCESGGMKIWSGGSGQRGSHNWTKTRSKTATKTRTRTQTQHYGLCKRIMQRLNTALGRGKPNRLHNLFFGFSVDYRTKTKTRVSVNLTVNQALIPVANMASYAICSEFDFGDSWQHDHWD